MRLHIGLRNQFHALRPVFRQDAKTILVDWAGFKLGENDGMNEYFVFPDPDERDAWPDGVDEYSVERIKVKDISSILAI